MLLRFNSQMYVSHHDTGVDVSVPADDLDDEDYECLAQFKEIELE